LFLSKGVFPNYTNYFVGFSVKWRYCYSFFWKIFVTAFYPPFFAVFFSQNNNPSLRQKKLLDNEQSLNFLSFETRHRFEGFTEENLQQKERTNTDSNVKNESNILGSSHFGKLIKNLKNHGVECRCRAGDIHGE